MGQRVVIVTWLLVGLAGCLGGTPVAAPSTRVTSPVPAAAPIEQVQDVARQWTGGEVSHVFTFRNDTKQELRTESGRIRTNCGCSHLRVSPQEIPPGSTASVEVMVRVPSEEGGFRLGGSVDFVADGATIQTRSFQLLGEGVAPFTYRLTSGKPAVVFDPAAGEEVIEFSSKLPIEWGTLEVRSGNAAFTVRKVDERRFAVRCGELPEEDRVSGTLQASVLVPAGAVADTSVQTSRLIIPVVAKQTLALVVKPSEAMLKLDGQGQGQVKLLLRGARMAQTDRPLVSVTAPGLKIEHELGPRVGADTRLLTLRITRTEPAAQNGDVTLRLADGTEKKVRLLIY